MKARLGIAHCRLGTDGSGDLPRTVDGWRSIVSLPQLMQTMKEVGLSDDDIAAYVGGNVLRVINRVMGGT